MRNASQLLARLTGIQHLRQRIAIHALVGNPDPGTFSAFRIRTRVNDASVIYFRLARRDLLRLLGNAQFLQAHQSIHVLEHLPIP